MKKFRIRKNNNIHDFEAISIMKALEYCEKNTGNKFAYKDSLFALSNEEEILITSSRIYEIFL